MASIRDVRHALGIRTDHVLNIEQYGFDVLMPMLLPAILAQGGAALSSIANKRYETSSIRDFFYSDFVIWNH